jgi:cobalamin biosynthesis protein CobT
MEEDSSDEETDSGDGTDDMEEDSSDEETDSGDETDDETDSEDESTSDEETTDDMSDTSVPESNENIKKVLLLKNFDAFKDSIYQFKIILQIY